MLVVSAMMLNFIQILYMYDNTQIKLTNVSIMFSDHL